MALGSKYRGVMLAQIKDALSQTYASLLTGNYHCVDRIVLNGFFLSYTASRAILTVPRL